MLKRMVLVIAALALLVVGVGATSAQDTFPENTITVSGFGTAYGEPDVAYIELGVELVEADLAQAFASTAETMNAVIDALLGVGIAREDIQTTGVNIFPEDRYDQTGTATSRVYRVRNTVRLTVRDISQVEQMISAGVNAGANTIYNLSFGIADTAALEQEARVQAVENARSRAEQLAGALGVNVGNAIIISEVMNNNIPYAEGFGGSVRMDVAQNQPVSAGQLSVGVQVQITFAIGS